MIYLWIIWGSISTGIIITRAFARYVRSFRKQHNLESKKLLEKIAGNYVFDLPDYIVDGIFWPFVILYKLLSYFGKFVFYLCKKLTLKFFVSKEEKVRIALGVTNTKSSNSSCTTPDIPYK